MTAGKQCKNYTFEEERIFFMIIFCIFLSLFSSLFYNPNKLSKQLMDSKNETGKYIQRLVRALSGKEKIIDELRRKCKLVHNSEEIEKEKDSSIT